MHINEKIYSGILGKAIGVRLGAPIEPYQWTYKAIYDSFGEINSYVKDSKVFAADDDTNGPIFFVRALLDERNGRLSYESISKTWLNYARDGQGMFWWGGDGVSTEHTAYNRLKQGLIAPMSGSEKINGKVLSEQVGGQIFIDSWGLIHPGDIESAMRDSKIAASVSHDGEALVGAQFIAGMIAGAFETSNIYSLIDLVLNKLDKNSEFLKIYNDLLSFYSKYPDNFRDAYDYVLKNYSYAHYEGMCHIIPNACIVLIGLLYGKNDFSRSIEITCMCGWDTDSNAGVVGTILGVMNGLDGIPIHYREPINDIIIGSSMSPSLNVINLVDFSNMLSNFSKGKYDEKKNIDLVFPFKGSSSGLEIINDFRLLKDNKTWNTKGSYNLLIDNLVKGDRAGIIYQTLYEKDDFYDNRYDPVFSPLIYPEQIFTMVVKSQIRFIDELYGAPFVEYTNGEKIEGEYLHLKDGIDTTIIYKLPENDGYPIKKIGLQLKTSSEPIDGNGLLGRILVKKFEIKGQGKFITNRNTFKNSFLENISPFSNHRILSKLENGKVQFSSEMQGISITGLYHTKSINLNAVLENCSGSILLVFAVKGLENYFAFKFTENYIELIQRYNLENISIVSYKRESNKMDNLIINLKLINGAIRFSINGQTIEHNFDHDLIGHYGLGVDKGQVTLNSMNVDFD